MLLSIIIPVYNVEQYIDECLDSIFSQPLANSTEVEVIVVNDGTPDDSMTIVQSYAVTHDNLRIIEQENQGLSCARNVGIKAASGDYLMFVDSDDKILSNALMSIHQLIVQNPEATVFSSTLTLWYDWGKMKENDMPSGGYSWKFMMSHCFPMSCVPRLVISRSLLIENGLFFYPKIFHEDDLFVRQVTYLAKQVFYTSDSFYLYRLGRNGSIMNKRNIKSAYDLVLVHKELERFRKATVNVQDQKVFRKFCFYELDNLFYIFQKDFDSEDFKKFYKEQKVYIKKQALFLLLTSRLIDGVGMCISPISYLRYLRNPLANIKRKIVYRIHHGQ